MGITTDICSTDDNRMDTTRPTGEKEKELVVVEWRDIIATAGWEQEISYRTAGGNMDCAPDNIWTIMQSLVEIGGWALLLIFVAPMIIGWILPGPLERKRKQ